MLRYFLSSRLVQGTLIGLVFFCVGIHLYIQWDLARFEADLPSPPQDTEGHWHGSEWHADAHPPNSDGDAHTPNSDGDVLIASEEEAVEPSAPLEPPTLTREELPEALPYPMTQSNRHVWDALVTEAAEDPELMQKLLPDTKEKAFETATHLGNSWAPFELKSDFEEAMWRKLATLYPNDPEVLFMAAIGMPWGTRAEKEAFVAHWERIKRLNDEQGIPLMSELRATPFLSQAYLDLGEYDKAIQNIKEQNARIAALKRAGYNDRLMEHGLLGTSGLGFALFLKKRHEAKQDK